MRRIALTIATVSLLAGCGRDYADVSCAELERSAELRREMTDAVHLMIGRDREIARAMWETTCINAAAPPEDSYPYTTAVQFPDID